MKLPVIVLELDNDTIVDAIKASVQSSGVALEGKHVQVSFLNKRKGGGVLATVRVSSDPFLDSPAEATTGTQVDSPKDSTKNAEVAVEPITDERKVSDRRAPAEETDTPETPAKEEAPAKAKPKGKRLFDDAEEG